MFRAQPVLRKHHFSQPLSEDDELDIEDSLADLVDQTPGAALLWMGTELDYVVDYEYLGQNLVKCTLENAGWFIFGAEDLFEHRWPLHTYLQKAVAAAWMQRNQEKSA